MTPYRSPFSPTQNISSRRSAAVDAPPRAPESDPTISTTGEPGELLPSLTQQVQCYRELAKLADRQHICVQNCQTDELLDVLQQRQQVLDRITALEKVLAPMKRNWSTATAALETQERVRADALVGEARALLEQITTADRNDSIVLQQRKNNLAVQINKTTSARVVNRNYAAAAYGSPRSTLDLKK